MTRGRKIAVAAALTLVAGAGLVWLGPGRVAMGALGVNIDGPAINPALAAETITWTDLIPPQDLETTVRLDDGTLPRGFIQHGQLGSAALPDPPGANDTAAPAPSSGEPSQLARDLGAYRDFLAPPRRVSDAYGYGGIGNLKGLQPPGVSLREDFDGTVIKMAGFVTPLAFSGTRVTEFLLVPYVGACIHVPPPPANQIVYVSDVRDFWPDAGLLYPVWVTGVLRAAPLDTDLANVGYQIEGAHVERYQ